jgi:hypothetical protein
VSLLKNEVFIYVDKVGYDKNHKPEEEYGNFEGREATKGGWKCEGCEIE